MSDIDQKRQEARQHVLKHTKEVMHWAKIAEDIASGNSEFSLSMLDTILGNAQSQLEFARWWSAVDIGLGMAE